MRHFYANFLPGVQCGHKTGYHFLAANFYLVYYATDYANGTNTDIEYERDDNGDIILPATSVAYTVKDM